MHGHLNVKFVKINISEFKEYALNGAGNALHQKFVGCHVDINHDRNLKIYI